MAPVADPLNLWGDDYQNQVQVDCLLPTGIIIILRVESDATIAEIKADLWKEAQKYPLYSSLKDKNSYVFMSISQNAERVELLDETKLFWDVRPFHPLLKVVEKKGNEAEKMLNAQISALLGKGMHEFDNLKSAEVSDFRMKMRKECERFAKERDSQDWLLRAKCLYPPDLADSPELAPHLVTNNHNQTFYVNIRLSGVLGPSPSSPLASPKHTHHRGLPHQDSTSSLNGDVCYTQEARGEMTPDQLVQEVLKLHARKTGDTEPAANAGRYTLKVAGREEYLLGDYPLSQFQYIRQMHSKQIRPSLTLVTRDTVLADAPPTIPPKPRSTPLLQKKVSRLRGQSILHFEESFGLTIRECTNLQAEDYGYQLKACVYHGPESIADVTTTQEYTCHNGVVSWDEPFKFDISLQNVPRMARLCFLLSQGLENRKDPTNKTGTKKKAKNKGKQDVIPIAWVNIPLFDYKGTLRSGQYTLYMWGVTDEDMLSEELLNPIGTVEDNPLVQEAVCLKIEFYQYNSDGVLNYPTCDEVLAVANQNGNNQESKVLKGHNNAERVHLDELEKIIEKDPLAELHEQEKDQVWRLRFECHQYFPHSLPKLLNCVKWNEHTDVAMVSGGFLVLDSELLQYLLQLVQALKYESYLDCELVDFLLERALFNHKVGHYLFWLLRSEMHIPWFGVRFGLILEAFCRGNLTNLAGLSKQVEALDRLKATSRVVKESKTIQKAKENLQNTLKHTPACLTDLRSTLDPGYRMQTLQPEKCNVKDSKMRPLWLVWNNIDPYGEEIFVMYKNGDDLRQDMLTLQILRIMDDIWQKAGLDLRLNVYGCLSTGANEGLIGIVTPSNTIANIQKEYPGLAIKSSFNKKCLYEWLKKYNRTDEDLEKAMEQFSLSCAGYCVATYVLGVADRHSDNILLRENGQLFHIDFGHFLGHFKKKLRVKREQAPFVLTSDYVYVINRGGTNDAKWREFEDMCMKAYMILREKTNFILTLFMMMLNTGIPELSGLKDIEYLKNTLVPHLSEKEARTHFKHQFSEALKNSWKVGVNNMFHNLAKDNV